MVAFKKVPFIFSGFARKDMWVCHYTILSQKKYCRINWLGDLWLSFPMANWIILIFFSIISDDNCYCSFIVTSKLVIYFTCLTTTKKGFTFKENGKKRSYTLRYIKFALVSLAHSMKNIKQHTGVAGAGLLDNLDIWTDIGHEE